MQLSKRQEQAFMLAIKLRPDLFDPPSMWNLLRLAGWAIKERIKIALR